MSYKNEVLYIGSNFSGHDSAIFAVFPEEKDVFAIATERITRFKHDKLYAIPSIEKLIGYKKINCAVVKKIYFANSFLFRENESHSANRYKLAIAERKHFKARFTGNLEHAQKEFRAMPLWRKVFSLTKTFPGWYILFSKIKEKIWSKKMVTVDHVIKKYLEKKFPNAEIVVSYHHHQDSHALASYFTSPFENALIVSFDAWGDRSFSKVFIAKDGQLAEIGNSPCDIIDLGITDGTFEALASPAGIYAYITYLLGFKPLSEEGKVEALAAYGNGNTPFYHELKNLVSLNKDKNSLYINEGLMKKVIHIERMRREILTKYSREDIAASVQNFLTDTAIMYIDFLVKKTQAQALCLSGGAVANVIMNLAIFEKIIKKIHITPAMADDGTSFGAIIIAMMKNGFSYPDLSWLKGEKMPYYGSSYSKKEVMEMTRKYNLEFTNLDKEWPEKAAELIAKGKIGAIFHGRMEWGPRALGNRSIIADPRRKDFRDKINKTIKRRPAFQPFCPSILAEEKERLFENIYLNKHMTTAFRMKKEFWDKLPSAIHIDGTARVQFVEEKENQNYWRLLKKVKELTGYGVVINTSFNKHGRTIVETPEDAIVDFLDTDMDYVVIEGIMITRKSHV